MLGIGLGWAAAEAFFAHFIILILNASGNEFSWDYLQRAAGANFTTFQLIAFSCLAHVILKGSGATKIGAIVLTVAKIAVIPIFIEYALAASMMDQWAVLGIQGIFTAGLLLGTKILVEQYI